MTPVESGRITRTYTQRIDASPSTVIPLLCPVREGEWLDGWSEGMELIHSDSGLAEENCVFLTRAPGRPETVWTVTRHDAAAGIVEFVRVTTGLVATRLAIGVAPRGMAGSEVRITYTFTPLGAAGRDFLEATASEASFRRDMAWWERSMNHWLRTGELLRAAGSRA